MESEEIYRYGKNILIHNGGCFLLFLLFSVLIKKIDIFLVYTIFFFALRKYAGGYHESSRVRCMIASFSMLVLVISFVDYYVNVGSGVETWCSLGAIGAVMSVFFYAPVQTKNHPLQLWQIKKYGTKSKIFALLYLMIYFIALALKYKKMAGIMLAALVSEAVLLVMAISFNEKEV